MLDTNNPYRQQVALLLEVLSLVGRESCFALKGGTAINLFVRNMPRLSVDIDLAYLPVQDRETSLSEVAAALERIAVAIELKLCVFHSKPASHSNRKTATNNDSDLPQRPDFGLTSVN